jgi:hypothetical protein
MNDDENDETYARTRERVIDIAPSEEYNNILPKQ